MPQDSASLKDFLVKAYGDYLGEELQKSKEYRDKTYPARVGNPHYREGTGRFSPRSFARVDLQEGLDRRVPVVENDDLPLGTVGVYQNPNKRGPLAMSYDSADERIETVPDQKLKLYKTFTKPDIIEHEAGHIAYPEGSQEKLTRKNSSTQDGSLDMAVDHLTKPIEAINVLGRVNRERFKQTGSRFDGESLSKYIDLENKKPEDERFSEFSTDAKQMLEALRRSKNGEYEEEEKGSFFRESAKLIPALVKNEKDFLSSVEARMS
jgi:hypothetical protein